MASNIRTYLATRAYARMRSCDRVSLRADVACAHNADGRTCTRARARVVKHAARNVRTSYAYAAIVCARWANDTDPYADTSVHAQSCRDAYARVDANDWYVLAYR